MSQAKVEASTRRTSRKGSVEQAPPAEAQPAEVPPAEAMPAELPPAEAVVDLEAAEAEARPPAPASDEGLGRDRIQQQLEALKQREVELRRALAIADHPALAGAIRTIEGGAYGVTRVESKMAEGLSKAEQRRKDTLEKKLASAREKRAEIDSQIAALEADLTPLGEARVAALDAARTQALLNVVALLREHEEALAAASLDVMTLVPSLTTWRVEIDALLARG